MAVYHLRNGLTIDLTFDTPTVFVPRPAKLDFDEKALYNSTLDANPFPIDDRGHTIPSTNVIKMKATGTVTGAAADVISKCSLRFIQVIKVGSFEVNYQGKRPDEGMVQWSWQRQLLLRNIDCWVSPDGTRDSSPFQFGPVMTEHKPPNILIAKLGDTPGATIPLSERNRESKCDNYLWTFFDRRRFESIVTFVHADQSREMLESWKWTITRAVKLKWVKLRPEVDGSNDIHLVCDRNQTSVFGKDHEYADTLSSGRIANKLTKEAMGNFRNSPNVSYTALDTATVFPPSTFWAP